MGYALPNNEPTPNWERGAVSGGRRQAKQAIAQILVIEVGTVKWYTHTILGKLGVQNRTQTVAHSRDWACSSLKPFVTLRVGMPLVSRHTGAPPIYGGYFSFRFVVR
jgi:hypothetical protein